MSLVGAQSSDKIVELSPESSDTILSAGQYKIHITVKAANIDRLQSANSVLGCSTVLKSGDSLFIDAMGIFPQIRFISGNGMRSRPTDVSRRLVVSDKTGVIRSSSPINSEANFEIDNTVLNEIYFLNHEIEIPAQSIRYFALTGDGLKKELLNTYARITKALEKQAKTRYNTGFIYHIEYPRTEDGSDYGGHYRGNHTLLISSTGTSDRDLLIALIHEYLHGWLPQTVDDWPAIRNSDLSEALPEFYSAALLESAGAIETGSVVDRVNRSFVRVSRSRDDSIMRSYAFYDVIGLLALSHLCGEDMDLGSQCVSNPRTDLSKFAGKIESGSDDLSLLFDMAPEQIRIGKHIFRKSIQESGIPRYEIK